MPGPVIFQIEDGVVALAVVDTSAVGYSPAWQAPGGKTALTAVMADYDDEGEQWRCQVTSGMLTASPSTTTTNVPATFCSPAEERPNPGVTSYSLDLAFLQDPTIRAGLSAFLFEHDTEEAYFLLGLDATNPPKAVGRVRLVAGSFGGGARANLTADVSLALSRKPDIAFGSAGSTRLITGAGTVTDSGSGLTALDGGEPTTSTQRTVDGGDTDDQADDEVDGGESGTTGARRRTAKKS